MKRSRTISMILVLVASGVCAMIAMLAPVGASTEQPLKASRSEAEVDPASLDLGNCDAGAMMAMINRSIALHD